jgi:hypothetical protein
MVTFHFLPKTLSPLYTTPDLELDLFPLQVLSFLFLYSFSNFFSYSMFHKIYVKLKDT